MTLRTSYGLIKVFAMIFAPFWIGFPTPRLFKHYIGSSQPAAIDDKRGAGDVTRGSADKIEHSPGNFD